MIVAMRPKAFQPHLAPWAERLGATTSGTPTGSHSPPGPGRPVLAIAEISEGYCECQCGGITQSRSTAAAAAENDNRYSSRVDVQQLVAEHCCASRGRRRTIQQVLLLLLALHFKTKNRYPTGRFLCYPLIGQTQSRGC